MEGTYLLSGFLRLNLNMEGFHGAVRGNMLEHLESKATEASMDQEATPQALQRLTALSTEQPSLSNLKYWTHLGPAIANTMGMGRDQTNTES